MSYGNYQGNPYGGSNDGGYDSNPYGQTTGGAGYGSAHPYGGGSQNTYAPPSDQQGQQYGYNASGPTPTAPSSGPMSRDDFLARIEGTKQRINQLSSNISAIATIHQRLLASPDGGASSQLENLVSQTQVLNAGIKDEIKLLEKDLLRSGGDSIKTSQLKSVTASFKNQLHAYQKEETEYRGRYREAIARQYRIVNPQASEDEVREATEANWGDEGVFQTALKSNRSGQASSVLGAVRARHNDIVQIENTLIELSTLFEQLNEQVLIQDTMVENTELTTAQVKDDTENANQQLDKGIASARRARRNKWICLGIVVLIIAIIALVLGIYFGVVQPNRNKN